MLAPTENSVLMGVSEIKSTVNEEDKTDGNNTKQNEKYRKKPMMIVTYL